MLRFIVALLMTVALAEDAVVISDATRLRGAAATGEVYAEAITDVTGQDGRLCTQVDKSCWVDAECCSGRCQFSIRKCRPIR
mmetsp:Transcript_112202/g.157359  ORF Transcript_112202/g.157359 Transcript_112202/m.157359 type:complete len:82 (-) Transcript_112202:108-353(-)